MGFAECIAKAIEETKTARSNSLKERHQRERMKKVAAGTSPETLAASVETKLPRDVAAAIRKRCLEMTGQTHEARAEVLEKEFVGISRRTLEGYSRIVLGCTEKVWNFLVDGKAALTTVEEMCDWVLADQDKIIDEAVARGVKLTVRQMRIFKKGGTLAGIEQVFQAPSPPPQTAPASPVEPADYSGGDLLPGETKLTREKILELRNIFRSMPHEMSNEARAKEVMNSFPGMSQHTLEDYCRTSLRCTEKVWNLYVEGKAKLGTLQEICSMEPGDQDFIIDECITQNFGPTIIRKIRKFRKENGWGFPECIAKATGEVPANQPRRDTNSRRSLDGLLSEIADKGARWRVMVQQAIELCSMEEAKAGVHEAIFTKVFLLRELVGNQYDFVNTRLQRYINLLRKRLNAEMGVQAQPEIDEKMEESVEVERAEILDSPEISPIPEGERKSFQGRAAQHEGTSEDS